MLRKTRRRVRRHKNTAALKFTIALLVAALCGVGAMAVYAFNNNKMMEVAIATDKIHENIFINDVNVGGLSKEAAALMLKKEFIPQLQDNTVTVVADEHTLEFNFGEFSAHYDFSEAVEQAYWYGKSGSLKEKYEQVKALEERPYKITYTPVYTYDRTNITSRLEPLKDAINIEPLNASISRKNGQFLLSGSQVGRVLDVATTVGRIEQVLDSGSSGTAMAVINEIQPEYEEDDFYDVQSLIGSFVTKVAPGPTDRNTNIETALSKINDVVLYPGDVFSTNKQFGSMTYDNGYRVATVIVNGRLEDGMGGGVCQVSSTLYNAVLNAELEIVERRNHSLKVTYVDYGFDATLAGDYIDFKFKNDTDSPVFIEAMLVGGTDVVVNLYGREIHPPGRTIAFDKVLLETVNPQEPIETEEPSLPLGERVQKLKPITGYRYQVFKTVYQDGVEIERVPINTSYYRPTRGEVLVGTGTGTAGEEHVSENLVMPEDYALEADPAPIQPGDLDEYDEYDEYEDYLDDDPIL